MSDVNYVENARRLADAMSAQLTDKQRETFARLTSVLTMTSAGGLSDSLDAYNATYALAAGIAAGSIPMPDEPEEFPPADVESKSEVRLASRAAGPYL